jgi:hypothetical protein
MSNNFRAQLIAALTNVANLIADQIEETPSREVKTKTPSVAPKAVSKSLDAVERACTVETVEEEPTKSPKGTRGITHAQALAVVMGDKVCTTSDVIPLLAAAGLGPQGSTDIRQHLAVIFSTNQGDKGLFKRVGKGQYQVKDPSAFVELAKQYGIKSEVPVEALVEEVQEQLNDISNDIDSALVKLLGTSGYEKNQGI